MKFLINIVLLVSSICAYAQKPPIPVKYLESFPQYYESFLKHDVDEEVIDTYARDNAFTKFNYTFYHKIYYDQPVLTAYIRSILTMIEPNSSIVKALDIYITRSTEFNAFTIVDGSMFVNIAALAQMTSEAELAYLIAHEYGHYKLEHVKKGYLKRRKDGIVPSHREKLSDSEFSQHNELAADSLAFVMANTAGYDSRAMDILMQRLIFLQKQGHLMQNTNYNEHDVLPSSHPVGEKRMDQIKMMEVINRNGSLYPNGRERFENIKRLAEFEYLKLLDESLALHSMISFPLKKYLLTGDDVYLPTLIRGIRKVILLDPDLKKEGFMTTHFSNRKKRFAAKENIMHHLYYEFPDSADIKLMLLKAVVNFEKVPFYTFGQAFEYFCEKAIAAGYQEPLLDKVLYYGPKKGRGKSALNLYLKNSNNLYYEYASKLKTKKVMKVLKEGDEVLLLGGYHEHVFKKNWNYSKNVEEFKNRHAFLAEMREKYLEHELKYKIYNYEDFVQSNDFGKHLKTIEQLVYGGFSEKILDFDPRLYYAFKDANISSVEFLNMYNYDIRRRILRFLFFVPPVVFYSVFYAAKNPYAFSQFLSVSKYYRILHNGEKWIGQTNVTVQRFKMNKKRAQRSMTRLHRNSRRGYKKVLGIFKVHYHKKKDD